MKTTHKLSLHLFRVGAEGSAEADLSKVDVKKVISKVKKMITSGKFSKDGFDFVDVDGKVGVNVSYFAPPKYNVDADRNLLVHQQLGSLEYNYTLKPSVNFEHESSESGFSTTVQIGHHEGIIAFDNQKLENPMSYICGMQQVQELYKIREEVTPQVFKQVEFNASNINK